MSLVEDKPWESTGVNGEVNYTDLKNRACSSVTSLGVTGQAALGTVDSAR